MLFDMSHIRTVPSALPLAWKNKGRDDESSHFRNRWEFKVLTEKRAVNHLLALGSGIIDRRRCQKTVHHVVVLREGKELGQGGFLRLPYKDEDVAIVATHREKGLACMRLRATSATEPPDLAQAARHGQPRDAPFCWCRRDDATWVQGANFPKLDASIPNITLDSRNRHGDDFRRLVH
jgi:hypothetical protein